MKKNFFRELIALDWRWIIVGFCLFICFHMLPSYVIYGLKNFGGMFADVYPIWMFGGLAFVGFYIGTHSEGVTVLESGISGLVYSIFSVSSTHALWDSSLYTGTSLWFIMIFGIATISNLFGEIIQTMRTKQSNS